MRRTWVHMVALFALLIGVLPTSAIASLFTAHACEMPCCKAIEQLAPQPQKCCGHKQTPVYRDVQDKSSCTCVMAPAPAPAAPDAVTTAAASFRPAYVAIDLPVRTSEPVFYESQVTEPGIFGADSGPPIERPRTDKFGRAPPALA